MPSGRALDRFRELLRIPTISSHDEAEIEWGEFDRFIATLEKLYPLVHRELSREIVAGHSVLFHWRGRASSDPAVLMAHYDVVAASDEGWEHPPFGAEITGDGEDRVIWGRGTLDNKGSLTAILEAVEAQLENGFVPEHDIYLCFGHNEEISGGGVPAIVDLLEERGIRPALVLDEGGAVAEDAFPGIARPLAVVGVAEKGTTFVRLTVDQKGGHASTPPRMTATARLSRAVVRLGSRPFPAGFNEATLDMLRAIAPHATGAARWAFRWLGVSKPLLLRRLAGSDETRAMTQTTQAVTMLSAGHASNALAERAEAVIDMRVAVGSSVSAAIDHVRRAIRDPEVRIEVAHAGEPSPISPTSGGSWDTIADIIATIYPEAVVTPYVQNGATDSRHFTRISRHVYRFSPFTMSRGERDTLHAKNERMRVTSYLRGLDYYLALLERL